MARGWSNKEHRFSDKQRQILRLLLRNYYRHCRGTDFWELHQALNATTRPQSLQATIRKLEARGLMYRRYQIGIKSINFPSKYLVEHHEDFGIGIDDDEV